MPIDYKKYPQPGKFRHHVSAHNYLPIANLKFIPDNYPPKIEKCNWVELFVNANPPDILDLGCGKGKFLIALGEQFPEKNILGIDVRDTPISWINSIVDGEQIPNVRALYYSLANGLGFIESGSIEKIFYLFPDPWVKKKHYRRRAFSTPMLDEIYRTLGSEGIFYLATDVEEVHDYHVKELTKYDKFNFKQVDRDEWNYPFTNKESFCLEKKIEIFRLICTKK